MRGSQTREVSELRWLMMGCIIGMCLIISVCLYRCLRTSVGLLAIGMDVLMADLIDVLIVMD